MTAPQRTKTRTLRFKARALIATAAICAMTWGAAPAVAAVVTDPGSAFDPNSSGTAGITNSNPVAQSFTAPRCGQLTGVSLGIFKSNSPTNLTISIYPAASTTNLVAGWVPAPGATALSTTTVTNLASMSTSAKTFFDITLATPVSVTSGEHYAIAVSTTSVWPDYFQWYSGLSYAGGNAAWYLGGGTWQARMGNYVFQTMIDESACTNSSSSSASAEVPAFTVSLNSDGATCASSLDHQSQGTWATLPSAAECTRVGQTLLGWASTSDFPVAIAKRQVDAGWGAYDGPIDGRRMIFIPAGRPTLISGDCALHAIWSGN